MGSVAGGQYRRCNRRFAGELKKLKLQPHLVIEQCVEDKSPHTMDAVQAHVVDLAKVKEVFGGILG